MDLATHHRADGLILEATFSSGRDVARVAYPFLPAQYVIRSKFDSERKILTIDIPSLFLHGDQDSIIPISLGRKLYDAANPPKTFHVIHDADHNDTFWVGGQEYLDTIRSFALSLKR